MKKKNVLPLIGLMVLCACTPLINTTRSNYAPLQANQKVLVIAMNELKPVNAIELGQVKVGDASANVNCSYLSVLEMAKAEARKNGGNALKIIEHKLPMPGGSCHSLKALILKVDDPSKYQPVEDDIIQNADYAIFKVYRPGGTGILTSYDIYLGDSVICSVKSNYRAILYIKKEGLMKLSAVVDSRVEVPINIRFGKTYYLRCGLRGFMFVQPEIDWVDSQTGEAEFEAINAAIQ